MHFRTLRGKEISMRKALKQYNFDWMLWRTYEAGSRLLAGTKQEYDIALRYIPNFRDPVKEVFKAKAGQLFLQMTATYLDNIVNAHQRGKKNLHDNLLLFTSNTVCA